MTLIERLRATEVREVRVVTNRTAIVKECEVPINPDGPEAADRIEALEAAILEARGHIRRGCDMVPDEDEGLASDVFARAINHADLCLSKALGAAG